MSPAAHARPAGAPAARKNPGRLAPLIPIAVDLVLPMVVLYGLRAAGATLWQALVASSAVPVLVVIVRFVRRRVVDYSALFVLVLMVFGVVLSLLTGNPRTLLVRDSWIWMLVGVAGVWLLASVAYGRPALMVVFRSFVLTKVGPEGLREWEARWDHDAGFRQGLRTLTAVWGAATVLNAVLHVIGAFVLPLDAAPLMLNLIWPVIAVPLFAFHLVYTKRKDLRA
ncbi:VC0807 family protein [Actinomadura luteofluorescens]|uniref:DUF3159 domain-containing protein n=1 Tax=Actinomadura luteofluorescens TaxID=46163 RepID=A0A7Y9JEX0_9ACTN|nr:VC0807 family protein [Actinomadura luteofluorescens]NYD46552.1 hypothetical protein [Actinomadura luteofluorescens]